jgi:hypothetical protein
MLDLDLFTYAKQGEPRPSAYPEGIPAEVCHLFEKLALDVAKTGRKRFSADMVLHRIRWFYAIEKADRHWKANNNWTAPLARWFLARHPDHDGFFERRRSPHEAGGQ